jgi:hypothetical protein
MKGLFDKVWPLMVNNIDSVLVLPIIIFIILFVIHHSKLAKISIGDAFVYSCTFPFVIQYAICFVPLMDFWHPPTYLIIVLFAPQSLILLFIGSFAVVRRITYHDGPSWGTAVVTLIIAILGHLYTRYALVAITENVR